MKRGIKTLSIVGALMKTEKEIKEILDYVIKYDASDTTLNLIYQWYTELKEHQEDILNLFDNENLYCFLSKDNNVILELNCSDLFSWGCAEWEEITLKEIPSLLEEVRKDEIWGISKWCCLKRGMRPQAPIITRLKKDGRWTDELESLPERKEYIDDRKY